MKRIRAWWTGLSKKSRVLYIAFILLAAAVIALGLSLWFTCCDLKTAQEEVVTLRAVLQATEEERDEKAESLTQCREQVEFLKEKLDCYLPPELAIEKLVRRGDFGPWLDTTRAAPGDTIQFRIIIRGAAKNAWLEDILPLGFGEIRNLRIGGESHSGDVSQLYLSNILGEIEITYTSQLSHSLGEVTLTNRAMVWADCVQAESAQATVEVKPRPPAPPPSGRSRPPSDSCDAGGPSQGPGPGDGRD